MLTLKFADIPQGDDGKWCIGELGASRAALVSIVDRRDGILVAECLRLVRYVFLRTTLHEF